MRVLIGMILAVMMLTGCSTYAASRYSIAADNVRTLREYRGQTVNVGPFTAAESKTEIMCRGVGPIKHRMERASKCSCERRSSTS